VNKVSIPCNPLFCQLQIKEKLNKLAPYHFLILDKKFNIGGHCNIFWMVKSTTSFFQGAHNYKLVVMVKGPCNNRSMFCKTICGLRQRKIEKFDELTIKALRFDRLVLVYHLIAIIFAYFNSDYNRYNRFVKAYQNCGKQKKACNAGPY